MFKKIFLQVFLVCFILSLNVCGQQTIVKYLSGMGMDHTVNWDFYCSEGRNSGKWTTIPVPSCWEQQGFGSYNYGKDKLPHSEEVGFYRHQFKADGQWKEKQVFLVFEGVMTDTKVQINGKPAGKEHQGSFYQFQYDITSELKFGDTNLLEVEVHKKSANRSVNIAERRGDYWIFGGIYRPVYLKIVPKTHIERVAVDARANGQFNMQVFTQNVHNGLNIKAEIEAANKNMKLEPIYDRVKAGKGEISMHASYSSVDLWSPEFPNLYKVKVSLMNREGKIVHEMEQKFGFRTAELRPHDGFYLNGKKVLFKGVNRHSFWPASGRTTNKTLSIKDANLIKEMNMNAVRMSHYPPDIHFLDVCDSLGLMVLDELTGWQHHYDDTTGQRLVKEMVVRDVNHPSIVIWDNGNEGGFNFNLDKYFGEYDPQKRLVIHPWSKFNGTNTKHYPIFNNVIDNDLYGTEVFFPTEFQHSLYDGGAGAGLEDYWDLMRKMPYSAGGFIWAFVDGGIVRTDKHDSIDTNGNMDADGILGPYRQKEGSFFTIKQIWSPVHIEREYLTSDFNGQLLAENRYLFTNLNQCTFKWELINFRGPDDQHKENQVIASGYPPKISIEPGEKKFIDLNLPTDWYTSDALYLTAWGPDNREIFTWSWPIPTAEEMTHKLLKNSQDNSVEIIEKEKVLTVRNGEIELYFNKENGHLEKVQRNDTVLSLSEGPQLAGFDQELKSFDYKKSDDSSVVNMNYEGKDNWLKVKWVFFPGEPVKLSYSYEQKGESDFMGITFNYPEEKITGMKWLGRGPYHVWKNRLKGLQFGVWELPYNNTVPGVSWNYPAFKGNREDVYWVKVKTKEFPFTIFMGKNNLFFQMLQMENPEDGGGTTIKYPEGNIGLLNAIQPIGSKFQPAKDLGPQSQLNIFLNNHSSYKGTLWFDFRD